MAETLYLLGAGINRGIVDPHGVRPPLSRDLFKQALRHPKYASMRPLGPLFALIEKYWHRSVDQLKEDDFDLEECFTFVQLKARQVSASETHEGPFQWFLIEELLLQLLCGVLNECSPWAIRSEPFAAFGRAIFDQNAAVLTFNYDNLLEEAIERASPSTHHLITLPHPQHDDGVTATDAEIKFAWHQWNSRLAYRIRFDEVALRRPGNTKIVDGTRYYSLVETQAPTPAFLKLHGSIGWYQRTGHFVDGSPLRASDDARSNNTVLTHSSVRPGLPDMDLADGEVLQPLIITPALNKPYDRHPFFGILWSEALAELRDCKRLIVAGYSFPPTDFEVRRLFREVFSLWNLDELCIVNPDTSVAGIAKDLCNFRCPVLLCKDLDEYVTKTA